MNTIINISRKKADNRVGIFLCMGAPPSSFHLPQALKTTHYLVCCRPECYWMPKTCICMDIPFINWTFAARWRYSKHQ